VSGRRWRGAVANKRRQVRGRGAQRAVRRAAQRAAQQAALGWRGTPRPNPARQQLGCTRRAAGGRRGPLDPKPQPTQPQRAAASRRSRTLHTADTCLPCITTPQRPSTCMSISDSADTLACSHSTTWRASHWLRSSVPSPVTNPGGAALAHRGTPHAWLLQPIIVASRQLRMCRSVPAMSGVPRRSCCETWTDLPITSFASLGRM
jgi:hypothetical protein